MIVYLQRFESSIEAIALQISSSRSYQCCTFDTLLLCCVAGLKCYFPTYKRRRWTSLTSNSSDEFIDFKECIMSSDPEKNKQSLMLSSAVCDVVPPTAGMQLVTFGAGPSHCS